MMIETAKGSAIDIPLNLHGWRRRCVLLALLGLSAMQVAHAMSLRELRALEKTEKQGRTYADYYLVGVMEGLLEANARYTPRGSDPASDPDGGWVHPKELHGLLLGISRTGLAWDWSGREELVPPV